MKFYVYKDGEKVEEVTANGYCQAKAKAEKKGILDCTIYREDDAVPKPKKVKKTKKIKVEENDNVIHE